MQQIQIQKRTQQGSSPQQTPAGAWPNTTWGGPRMPNSSSEMQPKGSEWPQFADPASGDNTSTKSGSVLSSPGKSTPSGGDNESPSSTSSQGQSMWGAESNMRRQTSQPAGWGSEKSTWGGEASQSFERKPEGGGSASGESSAFVSAIARNALTDNVSTSGKDFNWANQSTSENLSFSSAGGGGGDGSGWATGAPGSGWGLIGKENSGTWDSTQEMAVATLPASLAECWQTAGGDKKSQEPSSTSRPDSLQWSGPSTWQPSGSSSWTDGGDAAQWRGGEGKSEQGAPPSSWPQAQRQVSQQGQTNASAAAAAALSNAAPGSKPQSREDAIARAISSKENWGKTPIRQDTPWDIEEQPKPPMVRSQSVTQQWGTQPNSGTATVWESVRQEGAKEPARSGSRGSSSGSDSLDWNATKDNDLGNWVGPPSADNPNGNNWNGTNAPDSSDNPTQWNATGKPEGNWGRKEGSSSSSWADESDGGWGEPGKTETGTWEDPAGPSTGNWEGGSSSSVSGVDVDNGTSLWGKPGITASTTATAIQRQPSWSGSGPKDSFVPPPSKSNDLADSNSWNSGMNIQGKSGSWGETSQFAGSQGVGLPGQKASTPTGILQPDWANVPRKIQGSNTSAMAGRSSSQMMRSQMLQELVRQGFKKEDAQGALIANNMNFDNARADLLAAAQGRRPSIDIPKGRQLRGSSMEDLSDASRMDPITGGPPPQLSSVLPGQIPPPNVLGPAVPNPNLAPANIQQRMPLGNQVPAVGPGPIRPMSVPPPTMGGPMPSGMLPAQQQATMQQILAAIGQQGPVANNLVQQLPANQQVMLQQILQIKTMLQKLTAEQQLLIRSPNPQHRQSLEGLQTMIQQLTLQEQQHIVALFQALQQQQQALGKQPMPHGGMMPGGPSIGGPAGDLGLSNLNIKDSVVGAGTDAHFAKWKQESEVGGMFAHKLTTPPGVEIPGSFRQPGDNVGGFPFAGGQGGIGWPDQNNQWSTGKSSDGNQGISPGGGSQARLDIEEFIPGRPWQGLAKSAADDPNLTPGTAASRLSMNRIEEDYVNNMLGGKLPGPIGANSTWSQGMPPNEAPMRQWSGDGGMPVTGDIWGMRGVRPPAAPISQQNAPRQQQWQRSMSWAPDDRIPRPAGVMPTATSANWLAVKNVTPQVDVNMLRMLCSQAGACQVFPVPKAAQLMVRYNNRDDVIRAQKHINGRVIANTKILADVVVDPSVLQMLDSCIGNAAGNVPNAAGAQTWNMSPSGANTSMGASGWNAQGSGGATWPAPGAGGAWSAQDSNSMLPGDLLGSH